MTSILKVDTIQTAAGGTPTAADLGLNVTGGVLQVVQNLQSGDISISSSAVSAPLDASWQNSTISASITPTYATSKILINLMFKCSANNGSGTIGNPYFGGRVTYSTGGSYSIVPPVGPTKSGSAQAHFNISPDRADGSQYRMTSANCIQLLHSPNTTSQITYRLEIAGFLSPQILFFGSPVNTGSSDDNYWTEPYGFTLYEIAG